MGEPGFGGHRREQSLPIGRHIFYARRQSGVTVTRVPIHGDAEGTGNSFHSDAVNADVFDQTSACVGRFEKDAGGHPFENRQTVHFDVADSARSLAPYGDARGAAPDGVVAKDDLFGGAVYAQAIGIASRFETKRIVIAVDITVLDEDVR